ncbi:uncharacterized protein METZ01_LOCUS261529, partial [marine metagenome]
VRRHAEPPLRLGHVVHAGPASSAPEPVHQGADRRIPGRDPVRSDRHRQPLLGRCPRRGRCTRCRRAARPDSGRLLAPLAFPKRL